MNLSPTIGTNTSGPFGPEVMPFHVSHRIGAQLAEAETTCRDAITAHKRAKAYVLELANSCHTTSGQMYAAIGELTETANLALDAIAARNLLRAALQGRV